MPAVDLSFGTSGLRGLVEALQGQAARRYVRAFLDHASRVSDKRFSRVYLGRDFRSSSPNILADCAMAIADAGFEPVNCGTLPTPALALHAQAEGGAAIMVTGSHIPADRNGLKFYLPDGEISKTDEAGIVAHLGSRAIPDNGASMVDESHAARKRYIARFAPFLPELALAGKRIGVFEHSTVARDMLEQVLDHFGADVVPLGRSADFTPVDTEAFGDALFAPLPGWIADYDLDAVVSADGDGDRPLVVDETGAFVRGDVLGMLAARYLRAETVVTPVTSNTALEATGLFSKIVRTRVGSPYVVEAMQQGQGAVIGFEANGGTFVGAGVSANGYTLEPLVTRDAILPILSALGEAARLRQSLSAVVADLPLRHALAGRLQNVPSQVTQRFLDRLRTDPVYAGKIFAPHGVSRRADIDGLQVWTDSGDMVHFRASGNAPELRCYVEADTAHRAQDMLDWGLGVASSETRE